jgi:hypothetical protein
LRGDEGLLNPHGEERGNAARLEPRGHDSRSTAPLSGVVASLLRRLSGNA